MKRTYTPQSSNVKKIDYDPEAQELTIQFMNSPKVYTYTKVPDSVVKELEAAPSAGSFIAKNIVRKYDTKATGPQQGAEKDHML